MNYQSEQNEIRIVSDNTDKVLNQAVKRKLRQQYPRLDIHGKKIRVVSSQGDGVIDPSRVKIVSITRARVPLRPVSSVRKFPPVRISNASGSDKENTPPEGTREDQESESRCPSDPSFFSVSSDGEKRPPVSPEPSKYQYSSSLNLLSLSSDEDDNDESSQQRITGDSLGSSNNNNNNNNCKKGNEDRLDNEATITSPSGLYDPCNDRFYPLDSIKKRLIDSNLCSEALLKTCLDYNMNWIRLDVNWNVEISSLALGRAFGSHIIDLITNPTQVYDQADTMDDIKSLGDKEHDSNKKRNEDTEKDEPFAELEDLSSASGGYKDVENPPIVNSAIWSTDALLNWHDEVADHGDQVAGPHVETLDVEEGCAAAVSPPSLYHRPREDMMAVLGLVTHEQARINR